MNKLLKVINYIIVIFISTIFLVNIYSVYNCSYAASTDPYQNPDSVTNPLTNPDYYKPSSSTYNNSSFNTKVKIILGVIRNVGVVSSVIILMIIGIRYILGSLEEKADYKKTLFPFLIGAIVLFAGSVIPDVIYTTMTK